MNGRNAKRHPRELMTQSQVATANCQLCFKERATVLVPSGKGPYRLGPHCLGILREIAAEAGFGYLVEARTL